MPAKSMDSHIWEPSGPPWFGGYGVGRGAWMAGAWAHLGWGEEALEFWREPRREWGAVRQCASWMPVY